MRITPAFRFQEWCSMGTALSALLVASQCTECMGFNLNRCSAKSILSVAGQELGGSIPDNGLFGRDIYSRNLKKKRELILASGSGKCIICNWLSPRYLVCVFIFWILFQVTGSCWGQDELNLLVAEFCISLVQKEWVVIKVEHLAGWEEQILLLWWIFAMCIAVIMNGCERCSRLRINTFYHICLCPAWNGIRASRHLIRDLLSFSQVPVFLWPITDIPE